MDTTVWYLPAEGGLEEVEKGIGGLNCEGQRFDLG